MLPPSPPPAGEGDSEQWGASFAFQHQIRGIFYTNPRYQPPSAHSHSPPHSGIVGQTGLTYTLHMFHVYSFIQEHSNKYYLLMAKNFVQFILQCFSLKVIFQDICKIFAGVYRMRTAEIGLLHFIELFTPRRLLLAADNPDAGWLTAPAPLPVPHLSSPACNQ